MERDMSEQQIFLRRRQVDAALVARFAGLPVANISDVMARLVAGGPRLRPMHGSGVLAGPAFTVKTRPGDNLLVHKALSIASPGDVVVVDAGGDLTNAIVGELMVSYAQSRGLGGIVINGSIRDSDILRAGTFPVFAAGITHRGPYKDGPGQINVPVSLDGMVVEPGDLIVGDGDGLLCIPYEDAETIYAAAEAKRKQEDQTILDIQNGQLDIRWIDEQLNRLGYRLPPGM
jgi:RraA family protein